MLNLKYMNCAKRIRFEICKTTMDRFHYNCEYEKYLATMDTSDKYVLNKLPDLKKLILEQVNIFTTNYLKVVDANFIF